jgi:hypothetical protein
VSHNVELGTALRDSQVLQKTAMVGKKLGRKNRPQVLSGGPMNFPVGAF